MDEKKLQVELFLLIKCTFIVDTWQYWSSWRAIKKIRNTFFLLCIYGFSCIDLNVESSIISTEREERAIFDEAFLNIADRKIHAGACPSPAVVA